MEIAFASVTPNSIRLRILKEIGVEPITLGLEGYTELDPLEDTESTFGSQRDCPFARVTPNSIRLRILKAIYGIERLSLLVKLHRTRSA